MMEKTGGKTSGRKKCLAETKAPQNPSQQNASTAATANQYMFNRNKTSNPIYQQYQSMLEVEHPVHRVPLVSETAVEQILVAGSAGLPRSIVLVFVAPCNRVTKKKKTGHSRPQGPRFASFVGRINM
jgi:hypothetical protein